VSRPSFETATPAAELSDLRALTVVRPMDIALVDARIGKNVENRSWKQAHGLRGAWTALIGKRIAIHGGMKYDGRYRADIRRRSGIDLPAVDTSPGCIVGVVTVVGLGEWSPSDWFINDGENLALLVRDPVRLATPIPCTGFQGLWRVPKAQYSDLQAQLAFQGVRL